MHKQDYDILTSELAAAAALQHIKLKQGQPKALVCNRCEVAVHTTKVCKYSTLLYNAAVKCSVKGELPS